MDKATKRAQKLATQQQRQSIDLSATTQPGQTILTGPIDCACVIHGNAYSWTYVDRLYNMLNRCISPGIRLHVYTEASRAVPEHMIKHALDDWEISGPKRSWWYKMQLFNTAHHAGPLLYFDLDTVIVNNIDWMWNLPLRYFWTVKDFKYIWRPTHTGINSSIMWWDTRAFDQVWRNFTKQNLHNLMKKHPGDQDYITQVIDDKKLRFLNPDYIQSWRWQCLDGGYDFKQRTYKTPGTGTVLSANTSVLVFHGKPKPEDIQDPVVIEHWQ